MVTELDRLKDEFANGIDFIKAKLTDYVGSDLLVDSEIIEEEVKKAEKILFTVR